MRPVVKGPAPRVYAKHGDALDDLIDRLGRYCSYCERRLPNLPAVEHVEPQSLVPSKKLSWANFLLSCGNCNSTKLNKPVDLSKIAFPHLDCTARGLSYTGSRVKIAPGLSAGEKKLVQAVVSLVGLDRHPAGPKPSPKDKRWQDREQVWGIANEVKRDLKGDPTNATLRSMALRVAQGFGHFSVWMTVFDDDKDMKQRLIDLFPGTAKNCFNANLKPIKRPGGKL
ncbi:MAG: HNH endonuclease [Pseudomonadota bacterium]